MATGRAQRLRGAARCSAGRSPIGTHSQVAELRTFQILDRVRSGPQHQRAIDSEVPHVLALISACRLLGLACSACGSLVDAQSRIDPSQGPSQWSEGSKTCRKGENRENWMVLCRAMVTSGPSAPCRSTTCR